MIILITGNYPVYDKHGYKTSETEFIASHGVDVETGRDVIVEQVHPSRLGAKFDNEIGEWVIL